MVHYTQLGICVDVLSGSRSKIILFPVSYLSGPTAKSKLLLASAFLLYFFHRLNEIRAKKDPRVPTGIKVQQQGRRKQEGTLKLGQVAEEGLVRQTERQNDATEG